MYDEFVCEKEDDCYMKDCENCPMIRNLKYHD